MKHTELPYRDLFNRPSISLVSSQSGFCEYPKIILPRPAFDYWSSTSPPSSFLSRLHQTNQNIKAAEKDLSKRLSVFTQLKPQEQSEIREQYTTLIKSKKLVALLAEQIQRSLQNIAANFR